MNDYNFLIYDYESFGINPALDRPAQFGCIRTDLDFNIIAEPMVFYCKQTNDYLPKPEAVLITEILPQDCNKLGISEPEFAAKIHAEFSKPNTCIMGYNNIRYDDEVTRYTFYRNFFDPYAYSWQQNNSRWDLLDVVRACYALRPEGINWAYNEDSMPSFRLEHLTKINNIEHGNAHDALADVYATIAMAKLIKTKQPKLFDYFFKHRTKKNIEQLIDISNMQMLVHVSGMFGNQRSNISLIAPIAWHPTNQNAVITCDLMGDIDFLLAEDPDSIREKLYTSSAKLSEGEQRIPLKLVHINKSPILAPLNTLRSQDAERLNIDINKCTANLARLKQALQIRDKVIQVFNQTTQFAESDNVETQLYAGFVSNPDRNNLDILRTLQPEQLADIQLQFADSRIDKLIFHYRARHFYSSLTRAEQIKWQKYRRTKLENELIDFTQSLEKLTEQYATEPHKLELLNKLYIYAQSLFN